MPSPAYDFRVMTAADLPLLRRWLAAPHVAEWWGAPEEQLALLSGDLAEPAIEQYVVATKGRPFGYLQCYDLAASPDSAVPAQPAGARGTDQLIGEPDMLARGHGSAFICAFLEGLFAVGCPRVLTDPDPNNARAIRAYEKAGFRRYREVEVATGRALLMIRDNNRTIPA
jgi:aminoglycoside 6'-N-acetyltransferase